MKKYVIFLTALSFWMSIIWYAGNNWFERSAGNAYFLIVGIFLSYIITNTYTGK